MLAKASHHGMKEKEERGLFFTELYNEGWLVRYILEFFKDRPEVAALLNFVNRCLESEKVS